MEKQDIQTIRPEQVARKLKAIHNHERPELLDQIMDNRRLVEMMWFLQYISMQPGGLVKFSQDMLSALPSRFGTRTMRSSGPVKGDYDAKTKLQILEEMPTWQAGEEGLGHTLDDLIGDSAHCKTKQRRRIAVSEEIAGALPTAAMLRETCRAAIMSELPGHLAALCTDPDISFTPSGKNRITWLVGDVTAPIFEMMDRHSAEVSSRIAMTAVTEKVFDALDYAIEERTMVRIEGNARYGKTESIRAWCNMRPGKARLVSVPSNNSLADFHRRVAEALGMDVSYGSRAQNLRERVEFVLKHSGMFIVLDEAAFLLPQSYNQFTAPARLNWVRTEIVDRGLPLALVVTPQSFLPSVNRFVKKTGYAMEQFFGRNYRLVNLPECLPDVDLLKVARIHFPEMADPYLQVVSTLAMTSKNYLQAVEAIARLARHMARKAGQKHPTLDQVQAAAGEIIGSAVSQETSASADRNSRRNEVLPITEDADARPRRGGLKASAQPLKLPGRNSAEAMQFPSGSLRGGSRRIETELTPVDA